MFPILYDSVVTGTVPDHYGIGVLKDALSCEITEERNGEYELTLKYPSSGAYANYLVARAIIKAKPNFTDDPQLFRIYKVGKAIGSSFSVYARHISYDLSGFPITAGSASNVGDALTLLNNQASGYTFTTDKSVHAPFKIDKPSSVRSWFGGKAGSILDKYGPGDWKYNNFTCQFLANRGVDRGVTIRYGKNLTKLENIDDSSSLVTSIMAFWQSTDENPVTVISDAISTGAALDVTACQVIDASESYENKPTVAQLNTYVNNYISSHITNRVQKNIKFDFAQISKLLKDRVDLCDTVHIIYEDYGISATAKCIKATWDVLQDKYTEIELGEARTNIADTIVGINKDLSEQLTANQVKSAIRDATDVITGNKGGYVILNDSDEDGYPDELLIMNTADISTATKVWRWNLSGLGYSSSGYSGPFGLAMTMDGAIVADYIKTGNLVFGGSGNTDGKLEIRDAKGNLICRFDKNGATVKGDIVADSFDANAGDGVSVEILTDPKVFQPIGKSSGVMTYDGVNGNNPVTGLGTYANYTDSKKYSFHNNVFVRTLYPGMASDMVKASMLRANAYRDGDNITDAVRVENRWAGGYNASLLAECASAMTSGYLSGERYSGCFGSAKLVNKDGGGSTRLNGRYSIETQFINLGNSSANISIRAEAPDIIHAPLFSVAANRASGEQSAGLNLRRGNRSGDGVFYVGLDGSNTSLLLFEIDRSNGIYLDGRTGSIACTTLTQRSSKKYKKNIEIITDDEAKKILELRPVIYDFKDERCGKHMRGFIAEEVDEVIPELVKHTKDYPINMYDEDGNAVKQTKDEVSLDYTMMIPYLTKMIQLQQKQIDDQQKQINELKNEMNKLKGEC